MITKPHDGRSYIIVLITVMMLFGASCYLAGMLWHRHGVDELILEKEILAGEIASLELKTQTLDRELQRLNRDDEALRLSTGLGSLPTDVYRVGIGGRERTRRGVDAPSREAWERLDRISRGVRLLNESFRDVEARMRKNQDSLNRIPSINPVPGGVIHSRFGMRIHPIYGIKAMHEGLDFAAKEGSQIVAPADGVVAFNGTYGGYGRMVEIDHGNGTVTRYAHNLSNKVRVGQKVTRGQVIALVGNTGLSTSSHLHYEVRQEGNPTDPMPYVLPGVVVD